MNEEYYKNPSEDNRLQKIESDLARLNMTIPNLYLLMDRIVESHLIFADLQNEHEILINQVSNACISPDKMIAMLDDNNIREAMYTAMSTISQHHKDEINQFILDGMYDKIQRIVGKRVIAFTISLGGLIIAVIFLLLKYVFNVGGN